MLEFGGVRLGRYSGFVLRSGTRGGMHEQDRDHVLRSVRVPAPGRQFGGRDQEGEGHRGDSRPGIGRRIRGGVRREAHLLEEGVGTLPGDG
jgi:hypothetical protein